MSEAHYGYQCWGAKRKVEDLEEKYPELLKRLTKASRIIGTSTTTTSISTGGQSSEALDLATVIKASQAISGEIVLDKLLASLMKILIENAGAQVGYLILETESQLGLKPLVWLILITSLCCSLSLLITAYPPPSSTMSPVPLKVWF